VGRGGEDLLGVLVRQEYMTVDSGLRKPEISGQIDLWQHPALILLHHGHQYYKQNWQTQPLFQNLIKYNNISIEPGEFNFTVIKLISSQKMAKNMTNFLHSSKFGIRYRKRAISVMYGFVIATAPPRSFLELQT
jgi:hypothetical protein